MEKLKLTASAGGSNPQRAFDIFERQWVYDIPVPGTRTGPRSTFRHLPVSIQLLRKHFPDHMTLDVVELGPHEGEHSFHLHHLPVKQVHAVEGRPTNFLKCIIVKNELRLDRVYFALGDAVEFLRRARHFDLAYCCGILYHLPDPLAALRCMADKADRLVMTTAVFDEAEMRAADRRTANEPFPTNWLRDIDPSPEFVDFEGARVTHYRRDFRDFSVVQVEGHGGVNTPYARLMSADGLKLAIEKLGGRILHFKQVIYPRAPEIECVVQFR